MSIQTAKKATPAPLTGDARAAARPVRWWRRLGREHLAVATLLLLATALRLALAARGWPQLDSDEGIVGLMVSDVLAGRHFPIFFYGQAYMGATLAYLGIPAFLLFGPTSFSLRATVTVEIVAFLVVLYLFTRTVYSRRVALCTLALLALGPAPALCHEFYARTGNQSTLLCGTLALYLTVLRLRYGSQSSADRRRLRWIDLGIGLTSGVALWVDVLILPFLAAAGLALGVDAIRRSRGASAGPRRILRSQLLTTAAACLVGMAPLIAANIKSHGRTVHQILVTGGAPGFAAGTAPLGVLDHLRLLVLQVVSVLLIGLPQTLGSGVVCPNCAIWPHPSAAGATGGQIALEALVAAPFTLVALGLWGASALRLARDLTRSLRARRRGDPASWDALAGDPSWWGRAMMATAAGLTVLVYVVSAESYRDPISTTRYLVGLYACAPVVVAPLVAGAERVWGWLRARRQPAVARPAARDLLAGALLAGALALALAGLASTFAATADAQTYGEPSGQRDAQLIAFLRQRQATRFYSPYWTCYRIAFEAGSDFVCSVVQDDNALRYGQNRITEFMTQVAQTPHPAYVFDLARTPASSAAVDQIAALQQGGDPRFVGYTRATVDGFVVYYYA